MEEKEAELGEGKVWRNVAGELSLRQRCLRLSSPAISCPTPPSPSSASSSSTSPFALGVLLSVCVRALDD